MEAKFSVSYYVRDGDYGFHLQTEEHTIDALVDHTANHKEVVFYSYTEKVIVAPGTEKISIFYGSHTDAIHCEEAKPKPCLKDDPGNRYYVLQINATAENLAFDEFKQKVTKKSARIQQEREKRTKEMFASVGQKSKTIGLEQEEQHSPTENIRNSSHWLIRNKWLIALATILILVIIASTVTLAVVGLMVSPWLSIPCFLLFATLLIASGIFYDVRQNNISFDETKLNIDMNSLKRNNFSKTYTGEYNNQPVAIKEYDKGGDEWFDREVSIMASLSSPYIVQFVAASTTKKIIVMEYVENSLNQVLIASSCPSWEKGRYQIALDITYGLEYLHNRNIIHCDLKTESILVSLEFRAKITDFNVAKNESGTSTASPFHNRKPGSSCPYTAPELLNSTADNSKNSDIFSYGTILWALGAKKEPFEGIVPYQTVIEISNGTREEVTDDTPLEMAKFIKSCWLPEPDKRPKIAEVVHVLEKESITYGCWISQ